MARIFITGSSDGLGSLAAQALVKNGHRVVLHARNEQRAKDAQAACPGADGVLVGDLSTFRGTKDLANKANESGEFDCVIHNAGLYSGSGAITADGIPTLVAVNTFAPYILTCLMKKPKKLVYVSSGLHTGGNPDLQDITWARRKSYKDHTAYADSKLHNVLLSNAVAERWPDVASNSLDPGWVPTKLGGYGAPGDIQAAVKTYCLLAENPSATGKYWVSSKERKPQDGALSKGTWDKYMQLCEEVTSVKWP